MLIVASTMQMISNASLSFYNVKLFFWVGNSTFLFPESSFSFVYFWFFSMLLIKNIEKTVETMRKWQAILDEHIISSQFVY